MNIPHTTPYHVVKSARVERQLHLIATGSEASEELWNRTVDNVAWRSFQEVVAVKPEIPRDTWRSDIAARWMDIPGAAAYEVVSTDVDPSYLLFYLVYSVIKETSTTWRISIDNLTLPLKRTPSTRLDALHFN